MIEGTCLEIGDLEDKWHADRTAREARRSKIHQIDDLIEQFERLNLAEEAEIPVELRGRAVRMVQAESQSPDARHTTTLTIADWMDALYDVQDSLMVPMEDEVD